MEKLWTKAEVSRHLGVDEDEVDRLVSEGRLTGYHLGGRFLRFRPEQVEALKKTLKIHPIGERVTVLKTRSWPESVRDFFYFYDFYIVSSTLLAILLIYLIASG